jgi:predicted  nucleic acid-binding Zn-ribbon protein
VDKVEAAKEIVNANSSEIADTRKAIDGLSQELRNAHADVCRHQQLLGKAILDRDNARKLAGDQATKMQTADKTSEDVKTSLAKIESKLDTQPDKSTAAEMKEYIRDLTEKVLDSRKKLAERAEVTEQELLQPPVEFIEARNLDTVRNRSSETLAFPVPTSLAATPTTSRNGSVNSQQAQKSRFGSLFSRGKK